MKVLFLTDIISQPLTGIGRYAYELSTRLNYHPNIKHIKYFHNCRFIDSTTQLLQSGKVLNSFKRSNRFRTLVRPFYLQFRQLMLNIKSNQFSDYIIHSPNYSAFKFPGASVVTIHDLSHIYFPECHSKEMVEYLNWQLPKSFELAKHIITVSNFSKLEIQKNFKVSKDFITTVPLGVSKNFKPRAKVELDGILEFYQLNFKRYLLSVATFEPRKNLVRLINAYSKLPSSLKREYPLVLVGAQGWKNKFLNNNIEKILSSENVRYLGYVPEDNLPYLYSGAKAFAYTSLYEGFGLPILEAMASGIPVLTSNAGALLEVGGGAAYEVSPEQIHEISVGLEILLSDEHWSALAIQKGFANVAKYSWEKCVEDTVNVYKKIAVL